MLENYEKMVGEDGIGKEGKKDDSEGAQLLMASLKMP